MAWLPSDFSLSLRAGVPHRGETFAETVERAANAGSLSPLLQDICWWIACDLHHELADVFDVAISAQILPEDAPATDALDVAQAHDLPGVPRPGSYCLVSFRISRHLLVSAHFTDGTVAVRSFDARTDATLARNLSRLQERSPGETGA